MEVSVRNQSPDQVAPATTCIYKKRAEHISKFHPMACRMRVSSCIVKIMNDMTLTFIGGGNMAASLIGGLIADGWNPACIRVADSSPERLQLLAQRFPITTTTSNSDAADQSDIIVLAVKPQVMQTVARELAELVAQQQPLVISIAAGIPAAALGNWLGRSTAIVRTMPNTPAMVQSGATALYANEFGPVCQ